ncbi:MAG: Maf and M48 domain-containing protein [Candidatus Omnitrophota bacterium]
MLILASKSKARAQLLKNLGIKFRVLPSRVKEVDGSKRSPRATVKVNALAKARSVSRRVKSGIVIACDTLVWQNGKIFGKPKTLKEARRMLKTLSARPHRLYSGLAVIDVKRGKEVVAVEETRIHMTPLSDKDIANYFKKVSPLDKAGGFDIQGQGSLFIKRIEGCYFNVVGLPLAKLFSLLKKVGVSLLACVGAMILVGCATEFNVATNRQDLMMYSSDQEVSIGDSVSRQIEKNYQVIHDPEMNERLQHIGKKIAAVCDRQELLYRFRVIEDEKDEDLVNAVSLPGGYIYVFKNLMKVADRDDELAGVLGHEIGHVVARHSIKRLQAIWGYNLLSVFSMAAKSPEFTQGAQLAYIHLLMGYSREDEILADKLGARYTKRAGYDPHAMVDFLEKLKKRHKKEPPQKLSYFRTHPYTGERVRAVKEEIGDKITFDDFINSL